MSDIVERVARAIADTTDFDGDRLASRFAESELRDMAQAAIAAMQTDAEPVAYWYKHPTQMDAEPFGTLRLTPADKADGWTETPLYAHSPVAAKHAEIAALKAHADALLKHVMHDYFCNRADAFDAKEPCRCGLSEIVRAYEEFRRD